MFDPTQWLNSILSIKVRANVILSTSGERKKKTARSSESKLSWPCKHLHSVHNEIFNIMWGKDNCDTTISGFNVAVIIQFISFLQFLLSCRTKTDTRTHFHNQTRVHTLVRWWGLSIWGLRCVLLRVIRTA